jgi:hypothetical protein
MFDRVRSRFGAFVGRVAAVGTVALVPAIAFAQATTVEFDPADTLAIVAEASDFITAVGLAVLGLIMLAKGLKWVRRAG